jgi:hypothetical protein
MSTMSMWHLYPKKYQKMVQQIVFLIGSVYTKLGVVGNWWVFHKEK